MKGLLLNALESGEKLEMIYISNKGEVSQRVVKIIELKEESFKAYCYSRRQFRTFKFANVLSIGHNKHKIGA